MPEALTAVRPTEDSACWPDPGARHEGSYAGLSFVTDDARSLFDTLVSRGVIDIMQEPIDHPYATDFGIRDPFGNAIWIVQPTTISPHLRRRGRPLWMTPQPRR